MTPIYKTLGILAVALLIPLTANAATPTDVLQATPNATSVAGPHPAQSIRPVTKSEQPKTIKVAGRRGRGRGLALGIIAGAATAAILSGAARGHQYRYYDRPYYRTRSRYRRRNRCDRWAYRCDDGYERACYKYDRYCD